MSTTNPSTSAGTTASPDSVPLRSASYLGCRHCGEGSLVRDAEAEQSRCRCCGTLD